MIARYIRLALRSVLELAYAAVWMPLVMCIAALAWLYQDEEVERGFW